VSVPETEGPGGRVHRRDPLTSSFPTGHHRWLRLACGLLCCLCVLDAGPAGAEPLLDAAPVAPGPLEVALVTIVGDTLLVHGRGVADRVFPAAPGVVTVIDLQDERGGGDLAELLARVAGLQIRRYGGLGAQAVPSLRGSTGAQVQVLIDGLPLADAQTGALDLSLLPLERFEIGAAGAVNLRTRTGEDAAGGEMRLFTGSFGDLGGRLSQGLASSDGARRALLLAHGRRLDNRYSFTPWIPSWSGEPLDLPAEERRNADLAEWGLHGFGEVEGAPGRLLGSVGWFVREGGRPGPQNAPSPQARVRHQRLDGRLGATTAQRTLAVDVALSRQEDRLDDAQRQVGHDPYDRVEAVSEDVLGRLVWTPRWTTGTVQLGLTAGGDWRDQWYQETNDAQDEPLRHRRTVSTFAGVTVDLLPARLAVHPTWRWQRFADDLPPVPALPWLPEEEGVEHTQDAVSPSLGLSWQAVPQHVIIEGHWHETVRQPTWVELFGQPGGLVGNRELEPERITGRDLGLRLSFPDQGAALRVTGFDQVTARTIIYYLAGPGLSRPVNIGRTRTRGVELEAVWQHGPVDLSLNSTWQRARDRGELDTTYRGKALPFLSDHELHGGLSWRLGSWRPGVQVMHQSENYRDRYNLDLNRAPARTLWNLSLERVLHEGIWGRGRTATVTVEVLNLTDNRIYDVEGYPLPGRSLRLSWQWR